MKSGMTRWKIEAVVEAVAGELAEVLDRLRGVLVVQLDDDRPGVGMEGRLRHSRLTLPISR